MRKEAPDNRLGLLGAATRRFRQEIYWIVRGDPKLFHEAPKELPTLVRKFWAISSEEVAALLGPIYPSSLQVDPNLTDRLVLHDWLTAFLTIQKIDQTKLLSDAQKKQYQYRVGGICRKNCTQRISQAFPNMEEVSVNTQTRQSWKQTLS